QPLGDQVRADAGEPGEVPARSGEAGDEPQPNRIAVFHEYDRNRAGRFFGEEGLACCGHDDINLEEGEVGRLSERAIILRRLPLHETILGDDVASFHPTEVAKALLKRSVPGG